MDDLQMRLEQKKTSRRKAKYQAERLSNEELLDLFPLPRYFQVHFSHLHEILDQTKTQIDELKKDNKRLEEKLDRLLSVLASEELW